MEAEKPIMLTFMLNDPEAQSSTLMVVIEKDNLVRMEQGDPITLFPHSKGGSMPAPDYPQNFRCLVAYEPDSGELYRVLSQNKANLVGYLMRGFQFTPVDGKRVSSAAIPDDKKRPPS
jgi:hypothetical protein